MFKEFLSLQYKSFVRAPQLAINIALRIIVGFYLLMLAVMLLFLGIGVYFMLQESNLPPFETINHWMIYYFLTDLMLRYVFQKFNPMNIKPFLMTNISKAKIVNHLIWRSVISVFTLMHFLFLVPLIVVLLLNETNTLGVLSWGVSMLLMVFVFNFINLLLNQKTAFFIGVLAVGSLVVLLNYYQIIDLTHYSFYFFNAFYAYPVTVLALLALLFGLIRISKLYYKTNLYLDKGLEVAKQEAKDINMKWLDSFGLVGTFIQLDIKMLLRNKRSKTTLLMSLLFVFYGLFIFVNPAFSSEYMTMFGAIMVSGGFLFSYGNYIPSWDSSYYPLMMTQKITYFNYLKAKWWLIVCGTVLSTLIATFYLYFGIEVYLMIVASALFNIGFNSQLVLLSGAYVKTPIDLSSNKNVMGDKSAFNIKSILLALPKMFLPIILFALGQLLHGLYLGCAFVALAGILGFGLRNIIFRKIEKLYKIEKYSTLQAYKQK